MENPGIPGEYAFMALLVVASVVVSIVGLLVYGAIKLGLKNPEDIP